MFNLQKFNRGKFNVSDNYFYASGNVVLEITTSADSYLKIFTNESICNLNLVLIGREKAAIYVNDTKADLIFNSSGKYGLVIYAEPDEENIQLTLSSSFLSTHIFAPEILGEFDLFSAAKSVRKVYTSDTISRIDLIPIGSSIRKYFALPEISEIDFYLSGKACKRIAGNPDFADIILALKGSSGLYAYAYMEFPELILPPDGELIIDTGEMYVTLNGEDVTYLLSSESEFFKLSHGDQVLVYEDGVENRDISFRIIWKDLYL